MAIHHAASGELIDVRPFGARFPDAITTALYKSAQLEVFRLVLAAGKSMPTHQVPGDVTVQCLEGSVEFAMGGASRRMDQGDLLCLAGAQPHSLTALADCSVLVTLVLHARAAA